MVLFFLLIVFFGFVLLSLFPLDVRDRQWEAGRDVFGRRFVPKRNGPVRTADCWGTVEFLLTISRLDYRNEFHCTRFIETVLFSENFSRSGNI